MKIIHSIHLFRRNLANLTNPLSNTVIVLLYSNRNFRKLKNITNVTMKVKLVGIRDSTHFPIGLEKSSTVTSINTNIKNSLGTKLYSKVKI